MDNPFNSPLTSISIGPGIRGIERGVERVVRLKHLAYVEIEAFIIENLVAEMECGLLDPAVIWSDAKTLPCEPFRGITDIIFAGYPCQPFSTAGRRKGAEDPRHLYPYIERAIRIIQPRICFFENVRGHVTCGLAEVIASLEGLGYRVHWGIYSAEETGAAHKRERVFILAILDDTESRRRLRQSINERTANKNDNTPINSGELAHSDSERFREEGERKKRIDKSGEQLADTDGNEPERNRGFRGMENQEGQNQGEENKRQWIRDAPGASGEAVAGSIGAGLEERTEQSARQKCPSFERGRFVARPGEPQQTWEHPRIISRKTESIMGLSAHGYHFREDILRALGNSVYEDTSELAFTTLIRKFL